MGKNKKKKDDLEQARQTQDLGENKRMSKGFYRDNYTKPK